MRSMRKKKPRELQIKEKSSSDEKKGEKITRQKERWQSADQLMSPRNRICTAAMRGKDRKAVGKHNVSRNPAD